jgi:hypothetical protein
MKIMDFMQEAGWINNPAHSAAQIPDAQSAMSASGQGQAGGSGQGAHSQAHQQALQQLSQQHQLAQHVLVAAQQQPVVAGANGVRIPMPQFHFTPSAILNNNSNNNANNTNDNKSNFSQKNNNYSNNNNSAMHGLALFPTFDTNNNNNSNNNNNNAANHLITPKSLQLHSPSHQFSGSLLSGPKPTNITNTNSNSNTSNTNSVNAFPFTSTAPSNVPQRTPWFGTRLPFSPIQRQT